MPCLAAASLARIEALTDQIRKWQFSIALFRKVGGRGSRPASSCFNMRHWDASRHEVLFKYLGHTSFDSGGLVRYSTLTFLDIRSRARGISAGRRNPELNLVKPHPSSCYAGFSFVGGFQVKHQAAID